MAGTEIVRDVMRVTGTTHAKLAKELGYRSPSGITERLGTPRISADKMVQMLAAMGYEVIVRKADGGGETEWKVIG